MNEPSESDTITRNAKSNLAFTLVDLPEDRRRHMAQFYAFCRIIDDIVDELPLPCHRRSPFLGFVPKLLYHNSPACQPALSASRYW